VGRYYINNSMAQHDSLIYKAFEAIDSTYIDSVKFYYNWDAIGWDWKEVTIDESTNTSSYKANPRKVYILKNHTGIYYKIHFLSYYNDQMVKGYPQFEFAEL